MKRFPVLLLTVIGVLALASLTFTYLGSGGITSAQSPEDQAAPSSAPTATIDQTEGMRQMMEQMHGPGSFEAMLENCPHGTEGMTPGQGTMDTDMMGGQGMMSGSGTAPGQGMMGSGGMMAGPGR